MASFQAKIVWKRQRKRENTNYRFVSFPPESLQKIPKKQRKKKYHYRIISTQNSLEKAKKERK